MHEDRLNEEDLDAIAKRAEAATPGPWKSFVEGRDHWGGDDFIRTGGLDDRLPDLYVSYSYADERGGPIPAEAHDLDFIAAARQDVPLLLAEVCRLRERLGLSA